ncbi:MAG: group II truncated hemoglobin [Gammaproteobacteria bacterium]|nr:group II truncated hemoglobin [Gammaproteobacteria bacterium]
MLPSHYEQIGGELIVRQLVDRFYDLMDQLPEAKPIRDLHPNDLKSSRDKLFMFLSGWLGGPPLYMNQFGHPRLRARHLPFPIGESERDQWLMCMAQALDDLGIEENLQQQLMQSFTKTADFMRNQQTL